MITVVGLGPAGLDQIDTGTRELLTDDGVRVIVRTTHHPAAQDLADLREVEAGDEDYAAADNFDDVYAALAKRVIAAAAQGPVVYAVPGSPWVGERSVGILMSHARRAGLPVTVHGGRSFLDLLFDRLDVDPLEAGLVVLDGRQLPDPLLLHLPTVIAQVDTPLVAATVASALGRTLPGDTPLTVATDLGGPGERIDTTTVDELATEEVGVRTTLYLSPPATGLAGLITTNRILRRECPWDRKQTHHSLLPHLVEEAYEAYDALAALPAPAPGGDADWVAYADVEEELGDLLLQVVFHATLAEEIGAFGLEEAAEIIRRKLVRRHPHVFADVAVEDAAAVLANWERIKQAEKTRESLLDGIPAALPALARARQVQHRAATVGFDWTEVGDVHSKVDEELEELRRASPEDVAAELGDVLFALVNLARHLDVDPELALRRATERFGARFRHMEAEGPLEGSSLQELDARWERAKDRER